MSEFFLELYSEEIPHTLQISARTQILELLKKKLTELNIPSDQLTCYSTPKRIVLHAKHLEASKKIDAQEVKGPKTNCPPQALEGFLRTHQAKQEDLIKNNTDKGEFYFLKKEPKTILTFDILKQSLPTLLRSINWKKSMRWSSHDCFWGRPLKSIVCLFDKQVVPFEFFHLISGNTSFVKGPLEDQSFIVKDFHQYEQVLKKNNVILDQALRAQIIQKELEKELKKNKCDIQLNPNLVEEVTNLVEVPIVLKGKFNKDYLQLPDELLILTMVQHQRYFAMRSQYDQKLMNSFLFVSNNFDTKKLIVSGNEKVIDARLSDAKFFWEKNKRQNLVKLVTKLQSIVFYQKLGTMYDKSQRVRQLSTLIADMIGANRADTEIAASISKADLVSDLVGEFPELQGILGKYFALEQGYSPEIANAIEGHYFPLGPNTKVPKEKISIAVALADKVDTLIGFFGIGEKPTSSKDPFALRRSCLGIIRIITENKIQVPLKEIFNNAKNLYLTQRYRLTNEKIIEELEEFLFERFRVTLKDKGFRLDITNSILSTTRSDDIFSLYQTIKQLDKLLKTSYGIDSVAIYKRAKNILDQSLQQNKEELFGTPDRILFQHPSEDEMMLKINEIREYFTTPSKLRENEKSLQLLSQLKPSTDSFFNNVKVNDDNQQLRKNRLELLSLMCKTFEKFTDFSKLDGS